MIPQLSALQREALGAFEALLRDRALPMGLIAPSDAERVGERHVDDSLRAAALLSDEDRTLADIGPGAGLPGLVLAIARPELQVVLIEPKQRAVAFLELAIDRLALRNVEVRAERVEESELRADVATARAYGDLERSWWAAIGILRQGGRLIYFAGEGLPDPEGAARSVTAPEPPASVSVRRIAHSSPLVIMTRGGA